MLAYRPFRGKSKQKPSSSLQELKVVSSEEVTEPVSAGSKPITNTVMETKEKTENQTEAQMNNMTDKAVGKN